MKRCELKRLVLALLVVSICVGTSEAQESDNSKADEWTVDNSAGFPVWIASNREVGHISHREIYVYVERENFSESKIVKALSAIASEFPSPETLFLLAYSDRAIVQKAVDRSKIGVTVDFASSPEGNRAARNYGLRTEVRTGGQFRARYWRFPDGREWIDLSPDPDQDHLKRIDLKHSNAEYTEQAGGDLLTAATRGDLEQIKALLDGGFELGTEARNGWTALVCAAGSGQIDVVKLLLENATRQKATQENGNLALVSAAGDGGTEIVGLLLDKGANVNAHNSSDGNGFGDTGLILAAEQGHLGTVQALIGAGAKVDEVNRFGETALMLASIAGYPDIVRVLIQSGAKVDARDEDGATALIAAADDAGVVKTLVDAGADYRLRDKDGMTALMRAISGFQAKKEDALIESGSGKESIAAARSYIVSPTGAAEMYPTFRKEEGYRILSEIYVKLGLKKDAIAASQQAVIELGDHPHLRARLGFTYLAVGDKASAVVQYQMLVAQQASASDEQMKSLYQGWIDALSREISKH
jgi:ankyrin repeat protein